MKKVYSLITKELHNGFETEEYRKGNDRFLFSGKVWNDDEAIMTFRLFTDITKNKDGLYKLNDSWTAEAPSHIYYIGSLALTHAAPVIEEGFACIIEDLFKGMDVDVTISSCNSSRNETGIFKQDTMIGFFK